MAFRVLNKINSGYTNSVGKYFLKNVNFFGSTSKTFEQSKAFVESSQTSEQRIQNTATSSTNNNNISGNAMLQHKTGVKENSILKFFNNNNNNHQSAGVKSNMKIGKPRSAEEIMINYRKQHTDNSLEVNENLEVPESESYKYEKSKLDKNQNNGGFRFQQSMTHANASYPLKPFRLASPFPGPVKVMPSQQVTDTEKAEAMLAESKHVQRAMNHTSTSNRMKNRRHFSTTSRNFADCKKSGCPDKQLANCPERTNWTCNRPSIYPPCKKQDAPYPAYSEFCHTELDEKPSECKMCPWRIDPRFQPPKKRYHTWAGRNHLILSNPNQILTPTKSCLNNITTQSSSMQYSTRAADESMENEKNNLTENKKEKRSSKILDEMKKMDGAKDVEREIRNEKKTNDLRESMRSSLKQLHLFGKKKGEQLVEQLKQRSTTLNEETNTPINNNTISLKYNKSDLIEKIRNDYKLKYFSTNRQSSLCDRPYLSIPNIDRKLFSIRYNENKEQPERAKQRNYKRKSNKEEQIEV